MTMSANRSDREFKKFCETPSGKTAVRVCTETGEPIEVTGTIIQGGGTTPTIGNVNVTSTGTEFSYALPADTKQFLIRSRSRAELQLAFTTGLTSTTFLTISRDSVYEEDNLKTSVTLYFEADKTGVVEIVSWA